METVGSLIDKLSINELKVYHMTEQKNRDDVSQEFAAECERRLGVLNLQKKDLANELQGLMDDVVKGKRELKVYRQMKMYNEKKFQD